VYTDSPLHWFWRRRLELIKFILLCKDHNVFWKDSD